MTERQPQWLKDLLKRLREGQREVDRISDKATAQRPIGQPDSFFGRQPTLQEEPPREPMDLEALFGRQPISPVSERITAPFVPEEVEPSPIDPLLEQVYKRGGVVLTDSQGVPVDFGNQSMQEHLALLDEGFELVPASETQDAFTTFPPPTRQLPPFGERETGAIAGFRQRRQEEATGLERLAVTPRFEVGGAGFSAADVAAIAAVGTQAVMALRQIAPIVARGINTRFQITTKAEINRFARSVGVQIDKATRNNLLRDYQRGLGQALEGELRAFQARTGTNIPTKTATKAIQTVMRQVNSRTVARQIVERLRGAPITAEAGQSAASTVAQETSSSLPAILTNILPKFTPSGTAIPGQTQPLATIQAGIRAQQPPLVPGEPKRVPEVIEQLRNSFQVADIAEETLAVLPDGTGLTSPELSGRQGGAFQHLIEGLPPPQEWLNAGVARTVFEEGNILNIELAGDITQAQFNKLSQMMSGASSVNIDFTDINGNVVNTIEGTPNVVRNQLRQAIEEPTPPEGVPIPIAEVPIEVPPPLSPPEQAVLEGVPAEAGVELMPDLRTSEEVLSVMNRPTISRDVANIKVIRDVVKHLNPSAVADTPHLKHNQVSAVLRFESKQRTKVVMSHPLKIGDQQKIFGKVDDKGLIASGVLKGVGVNDIRSNPGKYPLSPKQKEWVEAMNDVEKAKLDFLRRNGIEINELTFGEGGQYAGRRWVFRRTPDGTLIESANVGGRRPGAKLAAEKHRIFKTQAEGIAEGFFPMSEDEALSLNVEGAYNRVADKQAAEWLLTQVDWRTTKAPEQLVIAAEGTKVKLQRSRQLVAALNRAVRGERVPDVTINSIGITYPNEAQRLGDLIPELQRGAPVAKEVQSLTKDAKELVDIAQKENFQAVNARARAREQALQVGFQEGTIPAPAFAGKIFTGTEARELTRAITKDLQRSAPDILRSVNKVNAISRYFMLAGDLSPVGIQLLFLMGANPKIYGQAAVGMLKGIFDPRFLPRFYDQHRETINSSPDLILSGGGTTEFTEAAAKGGLLSSKARLLPQEESFFKQVGLLAPRAVAKAGATVLEPFMRAFEAALDTAGILMKESLSYKATTPEQNEELDAFVNEFRGLASAERLGVSPTWREAERLATLAPGYNRAIASLLHDVGAGNLRGELARSSLAKGIMALIMLSVAISLARREDPLKHLNPRDTSNFLTWEVAGQRIGFGSKIVSLIKLVAQWTKALEDGEPERLFDLSMDNPTLRFIRGNLSPVIATGIDLITGKNYIGDPTRDSILSFTKEVILGNLAPIWTQSVLMEGGATSERAVRGLSEFLGGRAYPETTWNKVKPLREKYAKQDYGVAYKSLNRGQVAELSRNHPDLAELETQGKVEMAKRGTDWEAAYFEEQERVTKERDDNLELAAQALLDKRISKYQYDSERKYIRPFYAGGKSVLWSLRGQLDPKGVKKIDRWISQNQMREDRFLDAYFDFQGDLMDTADLPRDWDKINGQLEGFIQGVPVKYREYIRINKDRWIQNLPEAAKEVELMRLQGIEDETWWDNYRGTARTPQTIRERLGR